MEYLIGWKQNFIGPNDVGQLLMLVDNFKKWSFNIFSYYQNMQWTFWQPTLLLQKDHTNIKGSPGNTSPLYPLISSRTKTFHHPICEIAPCLCPYPQTPKLLSIRSVAKCLTVICLKKIHAYFSSKVEISKTKHNNSLLYLIWYRSRCLNLIWIRKKR